jgi:hypothetical protein
MHIVVSDRKSGGTSSFGFPQQCAGNKKPQPSPFPCLAQPRRAKTMRHLPEKLPLTILEVHGSRNGRSHRVRYVALRETAAPSILTEGLAHHDAFLQLLEMENGRDGVRETGLKMHV